MEKHKNLLLRYSRRFILGLYKCLSQAFKEIILLSQSKQISSPRQSRSGRAHYLTWQKYLVVYCSCSSLPLLPLRLSQDEGGSLL